VLGEHAGLRQTQPSLADRVGSRLVAAGDITLEVVLAADAWARQRAGQLVSTMEHEHVTEQGR
jgi:hypothetical protein